MSPLSVAALVSMSSVVSPADRQTPSVVISAQHAQHQVAGLCFMAIRFSFVWTGAPFDEHREAPWQTLKLPGFAL